ncbi:MAG: DUF1223 domain-containing protein [Rhodobacterales bacterium]|nr:DUF1223 domain-containing protein [Rhodobacterales bacterium]MDX5411575.1 DUF1223 domain-containing protein [Rhodobacterales bacterium]
MGRFTGWLTGALTGGLIVAAGYVAADTRPVVVELFTSQGCSSCPPADAFLQELSQRDDVIALALHVDYWDYIGWKDSFAQPAFTARQKAYAKSGGRRSVYTPQMIIGGRDHVVGTHEQDAKALIRQHAAVETGVDLTVDTAAGGKMTLRAVAQPGVTGPLVIHLVRYDPLRTVDITRGENQGKTIDYANVVTEWSAIGEWDLSSPLVLDLPSQGQGPAVVILQGKNAGPIMAAAHLR